MKHPPLLFFLFFPGIQIFAQSIPVGNSVLYRAGYQNIITVDSSRTYKAGVQNTDKLFYRPVEIDLWYPAEHVRSDKQMSYGGFLKLLEERSNRFQDDTVFHTMTSDLVQYISANLNIRDTASITGLRTGSYLDAEPIQKPFPLILYMTAFNGMSYENIKLFETLAEYGYIVACMSSVGRYPGNMTTQKADLLEQTADGTFALGFLKRRRYIDSTKIGAMGYSWGGMAALVLALQNPEIKCLLSFDGSELHYYGESGEEDSHFDEFRSSSFFKTGKMVFPYAYLESGNKQNDRNVDSIYNLFPLPDKNHLYLHFPKAVHEDFSCLPSLLSADKNESLNLYYQFCQFSIHYFDQYLKYQTPSYSGQTDFLLDHHIADTVYPSINHVFKPQYLIKGIVKDLENEQGLAYVNVGIPDENTGTVSRKDGSFQIYVNRDLSGDSLKFSMVGYSGRSFLISDIAKENAPFIVRLKQNITELKEVVVVKKLLPVKTLGNTTTTNFVSVGLPLKFLGSEIGVKINLGKNPVLLKYFHFNISDNRLDTAVFRLNIYHIRNGTPAENILQKNILIPIGHQTGRIGIDLSGYKLILKDDILISIEWIEGSTTGAAHGALFLSASFLSPATWHRITSQAKWKKASGLGVGFNVEVQRIPTQAVKE